jgi:hypothetical protein
VVSNIHISRGFTFWTINFRGINSIYEYRVTVVKTIGGTEIYRTKSYSKLYFAGRTLARLG